MKIVISYSSMNTQPSSRGYPSVNCMRKGIIFVPDPHVGRTSTSHRKNSNVSIQCLAWLVYCASTCHRSDRICLLAQKTVTNLQTCGRRYLVRQTFVKVFNLRQVSICGRPILLTIQRVRNARGSTQIFQVPSNKFNKYISLLLIKIYCTHLNLDICIVYSQFSQFDQLLNKAFSIFIVVLIGNRHFKFPKSNILVSILQSIWRLAVMETELLR